MPRPEPRLPSLIPSGTHFRAAPGRRTNTGGCVVSEVVEVTGPERTHGTPRAVGGIDFIVHGGEVFPFLGRNAGMVFDNPGAFVSDGVVVFALDPFASLAAVRVFRWRAS